jgi:hypothetical protein
MKSVTLSAIALTVAAFGFATGVEAQPAAPAVPAQPPRKLFFEGDIVRHALPNQAGPFCVLINQYKRNEAVAFRIRVMLPNGAVADDKVLKGVVIELGNGQKYAARYGGHGTPPTDFFWSLFWTIPGNQPTGSLGYKVIATMADGSEVEWKPFNRATTALMVVDGEPEMAKK